MRWIIAILLSLGLGAGAYFATSMWDEYIVTQATLEHLRAEQRDLQKVKQQYDAQAESLAKANALWAQIKKVGLEPDNWMTHSLNVSKTLSWDDFTHLVALSANSFNQDGGYWFKPERLRVVRVTGEAKPEMGGAQPEAAGSQPAAQVIPPKVVELYDATFSGKFLIRKK